MPLSQDKAFGFEYQQGPYEVEFRTLISTNAAIGIGDCVTADSAGTVDRSVAGDTQIVGVSLDASGASSGAVIRVLKAIQGTEFATRLGGSPAITVIGNLSDILVAARDSNTLRSAMELNTSPGTGAANFKITGKVDVEGNDWGDTNVVVKGYFFESFNNTAANTGV